MKIQSKFISEDRERNQTDWLEMIIIPKYDGKNGLILS